MQTDLGSAFKQRVHGGGFPSADEATTKELAARFGVPTPTIRNIAKRAGIVPRKLERSTEQAYPVDPMVQAMMVHGKAAVAEARATVAGDLTTPEANPEDGDSGDDDEPSFDEVEFENQALAAAIQNAVKSYRRALMKAINKADTLGREDLQLELLRHYVKAKVRMPTVLVEMVDSYTESDGDEEE